MKRLVLFLPLAALAALAALFVFFSLKRDPTYRPDELVGRPLPAIALEPLGEGPPQRLIDTVEGQLTVVNLFASWCVPCRVEHPQLTALQTRGVRVVGVAYKDRPEATRAFLAELGDPFAVVLTDPEGRAGLELGITGVPETFVAGPDGTVLAKASGPLVSEADVSNLLEQARAEQARRQSERSR
ncbi:DsbE family thiol:disulfide interchange protein [Brevundimonas sp. 2R-24]|uniref:DsbE family thiol:disulfide interchange protein n=1 Tax=Peiella sedimenti TaxID=3061083 RepID=A0ABT8SLD6_9CAUL|nr:DsbE family thiol:disulfide interchange protein [Caulobacteraceae bacterium XZ-24]